MEMLPESKVKFSSKFFPYKSYTFLQIQTVIKSHSLMPGCYFADMPFSISGIL